MPYGEWPGHLELFEMFNSFRSDPAVIEGLSEERVADLQEGSGAPEGRVDFPYFLQTVIRHRMRERFDTAATVWDRYVGVESAQDFREHTVSSMGGIRGIRGVLEHGEYPRLRTSEEAGPSFAVAKYGGIYAITYELTINDDTNYILNRVPGELGRHSGEYVAQIVAAFVESNPTYIDGQPFFSVAHDNVVTGAAADPTEDNIAAIVDKLTRRRDGDGIPINTPLRRILVPTPSRGMDLNVIIRSQMTGVMDDAQAVGAPRFARGTYAPVGESIPNDAVVQDVWLTDEDDYYFLADAQNRPPFIIAFLRGRREPQIFLADPGMRGVGGGGADPYTMDYDEIPYKLRHVFGVGQGEPKAAIKAQP